jgi:hypothetical protein
MSGTARNLPSIIDDGAVQLVIAFRDESARGVQYNLRRVPIPTTLAAAVKSLLTKAIRQVGVDEPV